MAKASNHRLSIPADPDCCCNHRLWHCNGQRRVWGQVRTLLAVHKLAVFFFPHLLFVQACMQCSAFVEPGVIVMILIANGNSLSDHRLHGITDVCSKCCIICHLAFCAEACRVWSQFKRSVAQRCYTKQYMVYCSCCADLHMSDCDGLSCKACLVAIVGVVTETNAEKAIEELKAYEVRASFHTPLPFLRDTMLLHCQHHIAFTCTSSDATCSVDCELYCCWFSHCYFVCFMFTRT